MPSATARDFQRVARLLGFVLIRQTGSHERWNHPDGRAVTIPEAAKSARHFSTRFSGNWEFLWMNLKSCAGRTIELGPRQGTVVPKGVLHRTRAPQRTVILMVENVGIIPTGN